MFSLFKKKEVRMEDGVEIIQDLINMVTRYTIKHGTNVYDWGLRTVVDFTNEVAQLGGAKDGDSK